jgi:hypothetical protein
VSDRSAPEFVTLNCETSFRLVAATYTNRPAVRVVAPAEQAAASTLPIAARPAIQAAQRRERLHLIRAPDRLVIAEQF